MNALTQYIQGLLQKGYTKEQITTYLLSQGYTKQIIQQSFPSISLSSSSVQKHSSSNQQLLSYILSYLQKGYTPAQLFSYLLTQGYDKKELYETFDVVNNQYYSGRMPLEIKHTHSISNSSLLKVGGLFLFIFILVIGGVLFSQNLFGRGHFALLDLDATPLHSTVQPGDNLQFTINLISQGGAKRVDVFLTYVIEDQRGNRVLKKDETKAIETTLAQVITLDLPPDLENGSYTTKVQAQYEDQFAFASFGFAVGDAKIIPSSSINLTPEPIIPIEPEINTTGDAINKSLQKHSSSSLTQKNISDKDLFNKALTQPVQLAVDTCGKIVDDLLQSECYSFIAQQSSQADYCMQVTNSTIREDCLMNFVLLGESEYCQEITSPENIALCNQFSKLDDLQAALATGNNQTVLDTLGINTQPQTGEIGNYTLDDLSIKDFTTTS